MKGTRKEITFDLDTNQLQKYYPSKNWRKAYVDIKKHMLKNGFSVEQIARAIDMNIKDVAAIVAGKVPSNV